MTLEFHLPVFTSDVCVDDVFSTALEGDLCDCLLGLQGRRRRNPIFFCPAEPLLRCADCLCDEGQDAEQD